MQAIETKYFGPSNVKGSRIRATAQAGSVTVGYDHALNGDENHKAAAVRLMEKFSWKGEIVGGVMKNGDYCWVMVKDNIKGENKMRDFVMRDPKKINGMTFLIDGIAWSFSEAFTYVRNCGFSSSETARYLKSLPGYEEGA